MIQASFEDGAGDLLGLIDSRLFRAMGDPTRLRILVALAAGGLEQSVTQVAQNCTVSFSVVSRHLKTLENAGVLAAQRRGQEVRYRVRVSHLVAVLRRLADALETCCPAADKPQP